MRNATIVVFALRGTATETIKNIVLAGIGKLVVVDGEDVAVEDLGAGFFFRDEDIGKKVRAFSLSIVSHDVHVCMYEHSSNESKIATSISFQSHITHCIFGPE
jgi:molybdopterin/thiamine biosynthesis adenylyltransferase